MADQVDQVQSETPAEQGPPPAPPLSTKHAAGGGGGTLLFHIVKAGQGIHVRWGTAIGAGVIALAFSAFIYDRIQLAAYVESHFFIRTLVPVVVLLACAYLIFWLVGRNPGAVEFMIATEGEMKKVNWSTRKEIWGATKVVIVTVLALSFILFVVDIAFIVIFSTIGVLKFDIWHEVFRSGTT
jgi:preprotein translocase SecE subunit